MKTLKLVILSCIVLFGAANTASAQKWAVAVNAGDMVSLGTVSVEGAVAVGRHATINASAKINPWTFKNGSPDQFQNRQQTYAIGARWWPWNVYSGWWLGGKGQYQQYNRGGLRSSNTEEGDAYGLGLSGGYALMLGEHVNLDFGLGLWGGRSIYTVYACPTCGKVLESGKKWFVLPNELILSFMWVF